MKGRLQFDFSRARLCGVSRRHRNCVSKYQLFIDLFCDTHGATLKESRNVSLSFTDLNVTIAPESQVRFAFVRNISTASKFIKKNFEMFIFCFQFSSC